jgi:CDP-paratose 2-epimerase
MNYRSVLITGGAGFIGASLALRLRETYSGISVIAADNLKRRGSELNLPRLREAGVVFVHTDIREPSDLRLDSQSIDLIIECSAEPSAIAGYDSPDYTVQTNLVGTVNCLDLARRSGADVLFLSSSRVYPIPLLNQIAVVETETRFAIAPEQVISGVTARGISDAFPLEGYRTLYGATKLCSEYLLREYAEMYGFRFVIDRCGVVSGPWQMGKVDQGVFALWVAAHEFGRKLSYIGWGGEGKQVRDLLHIDELADLVVRQIDDPDLFNGHTFNVGGGVSCSLSLAETTALCRELTGKTVAIASVDSNRPGDVRLYVTDNAGIESLSGWSPRRTPREILADTLEWIRKNEPLVRFLFAS